MFQQNFHSAALLSKVLRKAASKRCGGLTRAHACDKGLAGGFTCGTALPLQGLWEGPSPPGAGQESRPPARVCLRGGGHPGCRVLANRAAVSAHSHREAGRVFLGSCRHSESDACASSPLSQHAGKRRRPRWRRTAPARRKVAAEPVAGASCLTAGFGRGRVITGNGRLHGSEACSAVLARVLLGP